MERRLFPRVYKSLQFEYQAQLQGSEHSFSNRAVMTDISLGGLHFMSETTPKLQPEDIADFIFKFSETGHREPVREVPDRNRVPVESAGMADHVMENSKWRFPLDR
jgi:hypothetical protein